MISLPTEQKQSIALLRNYGMADFREADKKIKI